MRTHEVNAALRARFCAPEWSIFFEVGDSTGAQQRRWADAVAMNMYPSRGLEIHGFEVKVSRSDWLKELKTPDKSGPVQQYCDRWWIVCPAGIIKDGELPPTWGHYEVSEAGKIRQVVAAPKLEAAPVTRGFVASMMRRTGEVDDALIANLVGTRLEAERARDRANNEREIAHRTSQHEELKKLVREFEASSGLNISNRYTGGRDVGKAVKLVLAAGVGQTYGGINSIRNTVQSTLKQLERALEEFGVPEEEQDA
jgi:hypothetical protein